jgi:predicted amidophosphoribosyltransferase
MAWSKYDKTGKFESVGCYCIHCWQWSDKAYNFCPHCGKEKNA